jgi:N utilization substance protein B
MGRRRQAREIALQALYLVDVASLTPAQAFAIVNRRSQPDDDKTLEFSRSLLDGTVSHRDEIDGRLATTAANWTIARMAAVDRNVLRLAAYELTFDTQTPVNVVIDEAIEIVRRYSTEDSTKFVNGILDKLKSLRPRENDSQASPG